MPMLAINVRPSAGIPCLSIHAGSVRTMSSSAGRCGFSRKPSTLPWPLIRMIPRDDAAASCTGIPAIVTSAWLAMCVASMSA